MLISGRMLSVALVVLGLGVADARADQTIVFMRHGEKPSGGYGQLTCQGLNRALALPTVLAAKYGTPNYIYAPSPAVNVNTRYGYNDIASLQAALVTATKANTTIFVAWEHLMLQKIVQNIMTSYGGGGGATVPAWASGDYDSLYVLHVNYVGTAINASFHRDVEGLNGQSTACPN